MSPPFEFLLPPIVPRTYFEGGDFPGRCLHLKHPELAVTWVETWERENTSGMSYVNFERHDQITSAGFDIHALAMENLRRATSELCTHTKTDSGRVIFQAMMHQDALGSSRLLMLSELDKRFPQGYLLGIPERSCGIVIPSDAGAENFQADAEMVRSCYEKSDLSPMLSGLHEREMFEIEYEDSPA